MYGLTPGTLTLFQDSKKAVMKKVAGAGRLRHSLLTCAVPLAFDEERGGKTGVNILNKEESSPESSGKRYFTSSRSPSVPTLERGDVRTGGGAARELPGGNLHRTAGHHRGCRLGLHSLQDKVSSPRPHFVPRHPGCPA